MTMLIGLLASYGERVVCIVKGILMVPWLIVLIVLKENTLMPLLKSILMNHMTITS